MLINNIKEIITKADHCQYYDTAKNGFVTLNYWSRALRRIFACCGADSSIIHCMKLSLKFVETEISQETPSIYFREGFNKSIIEWKNTTLLNDIRNNSELKSLAIKIHIICNGQEVLLNSSKGDLERITLEKNVVIKALKKQTKEIEKLKQKINESHELSQVTPKSFKSKIPKTVLANNSHELHLNKQLKDLVNQKGIPSKIFSFLDKKIDGRHLTLINKQWNKQLISELKGEHSPINILTEITLKLKDTNPLLADELEEDLRAKITSISWINGLPAIYSRFPEIMTSFAATLKKLTVEELNDIKAEEFTIKNAMKNRLIDLSIIYKDIDILKTGFNPILLEDMYKRLSENIPVKEAKILCRALTLIELRNNKELVSSQNYNNIKKYRNVIFPNLKPTTLISIP